MVFVISSVEFNYVIILQQSINYKISFSKLDPIIIRVYSVSIGGHNNFPTEKIIGK